MALPNLQQSEVPEDGIFLTCEVDASELGLTSDEGRFPIPLRLEIDVRRTDQGLAVAGLLSGVALRECVGCLAEYQEPLRVNFEAEYRAKRGAKGSRSGGLKRGGGGERREAPDASPSVTQEEDIEIYPLIGEQLDLVEMLREQVILATPMHPLCRKDCLGLCATCGKNRNLGTCGCPEPQPASPFAVLRALQQTSDTGIAGSAARRNKASRN